MVRMGAGDVGYRGDEQTDVQPELKPGLQPGLQKKRGISLATNPTCRSFERRTLKYNLLLVEN
jgi:hypothetical protein